MTSLIHLNGPPGIGKSTIARRYAEEHPGVLNCDIDVLRTLIGGWKDRYGEAGALIRPAALALIRAYLAEGGDVVLPQLLVRPEELARFQAAALDVGATFLEVILLDDRAGAIERFHRRGSAGDSDGWHRHVQELVANLGGDDHLGRTYDSLIALAERRPDALVVDSREGEIDATYAEVIRAVRASQS